MECQMKLPKITNKIICLKKEKKKKKQANCRRESSFWSNINFKLYFLLVAKEHRQNITSKR